MELSKNLGWKVLRISFGATKRTSAFATTGALEYPKGKRVTPRQGCGPLTLFNSYDEAKWFARLFGAGGNMTPTIAQIVPVKYEPVQNKERVFDYSLWQPKEGPSIRGERMHTSGATRTVDRVEVVVRMPGALPTGTVLASSITCLE